MLQLSKTRLNCRLRSLSLIAVASSAIHLHAMVIDSISGPVTQNEINSFKTYMAGRHPAITIDYWDWTFTGNMGPDLQAAEIMYQITGDQAILDKAIEFADVAIQVSAGEPGGGPPNEASADGIGHAAWCAELILRNPSLWNLTVGIGDPYGYGTTYYQRALSYITIGDNNMAAYITPIYVDPSTHHYQGLTTGLGWNRQTMPSNAYHRLANCHELLNDNAGLVASYRQIVGVNIQWFLSRAVFYTASGKPVVKWFYGVNTDGSDGHMEDEGHANYDILGLTRCFESGRYGITTAQITAFANALYYVMYNPTTGDFSDIVDGTGTRRASEQPCWNGLARYLTSPDLYAVLYNTETLANSDNITTNTCQFAMFMAEKNRRYVKSQVYEMESMTVAGTSGDTYVTNTESAASNGQYIQYNSNAANDYITFTLPNVAAGTYTVRAGYKRQTSRGIAQVSGGPSGGTLVNIGSPIDMYGTSAFLYADIGTWSVGASGNQSVKFLVTGKNASSSGYVLAPDYVTLTAVSAPVKYEAESLTISATSGDTYSTSSDGSASNGQYIMFNSNAVGDYIRFKLLSVWPGAYNVKVGYKQNTSRGTIQVKVGMFGGTLGNQDVPIDMYGPVAFYEEDLGTWTIGTLGDKSVEFNVTGKNASSSGFNAAIDYITLTLP